MRNIYLKICVFLILVGSLVNCNSDDTQYQKVSANIVSEVTNDPIANVSLQVICKGSRGSGLFSSTYEISQRIVTSDIEGNFSVDLPFEDSNNFFTIYIQNQDICTDIIYPGNNFFFEEVAAQEPLKLKARKFFQMEVLVKNVSPYDENDQISIGFYHIGSNYHFAPLDAIENRADVNVPYDDSHGEVGRYLQPFWIGDNVDSTIFKRVQEGTKARISWAVTKNGVNTQFESEFIPTVENGVTYFEIEY